MSEKIKLTLAPRKPDEGIRVVDLETGREIAGLKAISVGEDYGESLEGYGHGTVLTKVTLTAYLFGPDGEKGLKINRGE